MEDLRGFLKPRRSIANLHRATIGGSTQSRTSNHLRIEKQAFCSFVANFKTRPGAVHRAEVSIHPLQIPAPLKKCCSCENCGRCTPSFCSLY